MSTKKKIEEAKRKGIILHEDHKLVTRRDFLSAGVIPFAASIMAPTVLSMLFKSASAMADCPTVSSGGSVLAPYINLHLSGGWAGYSHLLPITTSGLVPDSLSLMGLGSRSVMDLPRAGSTTGNKYDSFMGVNRWFFNSGFYKALSTQLAGTGVEAKTAIFTVCVQSRDDSDENRIGADGLISKAGLVGSNVGTIINGGRGNVPAFIAPPSPLSVGTVADLSNAVSIAEPLGSMTNSQKLKLFGLLKSLSDSRANALLTSTANGAIVKELTGCATQANFDSADNPAPITDPSIANTQGYNDIWGINAGTNGGDRNKVFASCAYNALNRQAGAVDLRIGGYDYHDNTRTTGDTRDSEAGTIVGRLLRSAQASGSKLFLVVTSDGAVRSADSATDIAAPWTSDRGQAGIKLVFAFDPAGRPNLMSGTDAGVMVNQIGSFTQGQAADMNYLNGKWSVEAATLAVFANYLKFSGQANWRDVYNQVADSAASQAGLTNPVTGADIDKILRIA